MLSTGGTAANGRCRSRIIVFGSFARREADRTSDIDVVVVRPDEVDPDDDAWIEGIDRWRRNAGAIAGNDIEVIEVGLTAAVEKLADGGPVWDEISRDGVSVFGASLDRLQDLINA